jgi:hypothetical protein
LKLIFFAILGIITGDQARNFFLKSTLPAADLAPIWSLSDLNRDGRMDKKEFSIAMFLIQKRLQGVPIPSVLPDSLRADPSIGGCSRKSKRFLIKFIKFSYFTSCIGRIWSECFYADRLRRRGASERVRAAGGAQLLAADSDIA